MFPAANTKLICREPPGPAAWCSLPETTVHPFPELNAVRHKAESHVSRGTPTSCSSASSRLGRLSDYRPNSLEVDELVLGD
jgi:hypothetical protein